jgi:predicted NBD/HSP70 family sugar kinase
MAQGVVVEVGTDTVAARPGAGRPPLALESVSGSRLVLGIHIGVRRARLAICDVNAQKLAGVVLPLATDQGAEQNLARVALAAQELLHSSEVAPVAGRLVGVGVGAAGLVDAETGVNLLAPNLGWRNVPVREIMTGLLGVPVAVDNNVRCMALAESLYGAGRLTRALAYVYARVGVGAGLVVDGQVYRGAGYGAGEIGHWTMLPQQGALCRCGNRGCLETLIAEPVLVEKARRLAPEVVEGRAEPFAAILAAARAGHVGLQAMLAEQAFYLGIALANLVNVMNPQLILLGGLLQEGFDLIQPEVEATMRRHAFGGLAGGVRVCPATFGVEAGEMGAAALALDSFFFTQPQHN